VDLLVRSRERDGLSFLYVIDGPLVASEEVSAAARLVLFSDGIGDMTTSQTLGGEGGPVLAVGGGDDEDDGGVWIVSPAGSGSLDLDASDAPYLTGPPNSSTGSWLGSGGDVDGDGVDDLLVGANYGKSPATWLVLGPVTTSAALADRGSALASPTWDPATELAIIGDANGDGLDDVLLGAPGTDHDTSWGTGRAWLVCDWASSADLDDATATLNGSQTVSFAGVSVASLGDVDGDGAADLLVADSHDGGNVYLVSGRVEGAHSLSDVAMQTFSSEADDDWLGRSVLVGADVDGDGWQDLALGGPGASDDRGAVWVYLGFGG
jgi:FG-GAP repeat